MLATRVINSMLILTLVFLIIFLFPNWVFALLASSLIGLSLYEFFDMVEKKGIFIYKYFGVIIGMALPICIFLQRGGEGYVDLTPFIIVLACLFTFVLQFTRRDNSQALVSISVTMMGLLYISWLFSFFVKLKYLPDGERLIAYLVLVTKASDVGAYTVGKMTGKHALIPRISPSKTIEGTIGGFVFSMLVSLACKALLPAFSYIHLVVLGLLLGILGQFGDLAESLLKRNCGVKDSGRNISGFGGVLDVIDSLIFTVPIFYFYVLVLLK